MIKPFDKNFIRSVLPHGDNFIFLDSIETFCKETQSINANLYIDPLDSRFDGHFDEEKIFPAVFQIEALAQLAGILIYLCDKEEDNKNGKIFLTHNNITFKNMAMPDSMLSITAKIKTRFGSSTEFLVSAKIDGKTASKGTLRLTNV